MSKIKKMRLNRKQEKSIEYLMVIICFGLIWIMISLISIDNLFKFFLFQSLLLFLFIGGIFFYSSENFRILSKEDDDE